MQKNIEENTIDNENIEITNREYVGEIRIKPKLNQHEISYLMEFSSSIRYDNPQGELYVKHGQNIEFEEKESKTQPGFHCPWIPSKNGKFLVWNGNSNANNPEEWLRFIINNLLSRNAKSYVREKLYEDERLQYFTFKHKLSGEIEANIQSQEDGDDLGQRQKNEWVISVTKNEVKIYSKSLYQYIKRAFSTFY